VVVTHRSLIIARARFKALVAMAQIINVGDTSRLARRMTPMWYDLTLWSSKVPSIRWDLIEPSVMENTKCSICCSMPKRTVQRKIGVIVRALLKILKWKRLPLNVTR